MEPDVDRSLMSFRAAIDEARHNGWREADRLGDEMEDYLRAVRSSLQPRIGTDSPARWAR
jgi:hypothetical protein